jgi:protein TonB
MAVAVVAVAGLGYVVATSVNTFIAEEEIRTELALITPPPPPPVEIPEPPKVEVVEKIEAPPAPPELIVPDIEVLPEIPPAIVAPVADPIPLPEPAPVAPSPAAIQSRSAPKLIASAKPDYPSAARRQGEQGTTQLEVCVNASGRVTSVSVARSSGSARLDDAAAKWIRGERFQPAKINGSPQDVCGHSVYYEWSLRDA